MFIRLFVVLILTIFPIFAGGSSNSSQEEAQKKVNKEVKTSKKHVAVNWDEIDTYSLQLEKSREDRRKEAAKARGLSLNATWVEIVDYDIKKNNRLSMKIKKFCFKVKKVLADLFH